MDRFVLSANLVQAIRSYLGTRPFNDVANIMLAMQQQIASQLPPESQEESGEAPQENA